MTNREERLGEESINKDGLHMKIIEYHNCENLDIEFDDGTIVRGKSYTNFKYGNILNPTYKIEQLKKEVVTATNGQTMKIVEYRASNDLDVQFEDGTIVKHKSYNSFKNGTIRNPRFGTSSVREIRLGETVLTSDGHKLEIVGYRNSNDIDIRVDEDDEQILRRKPYSYFLKQGKIIKQQVNPKVISSRVGETSVAHNGQTMKIIAYRNAVDIDVEFDDGTIRKGVTYRRFKDGHVDNGGKARIGETGRTLEGAFIKIIKYYTANDITVQFESGIRLGHQTYEDFKSGLISRPKRKLTKRDQRLGETGISSQGQQMKIIEYRNSNDLDVEFDDGTIVQHRAYTSFKKGSIENPNNPYDRSKQFQLNRRAYPLNDRTGEINRARNGQSMEIIAYRGNADIDIKFQDGTIVKHRNYSAFKRGEAKNPNLTKKKS
jgi:hypothetical protein